MPGAFGLYDDQHHPRVPADRLVENRLRLDAFKLNRLGAFVEGAVTRLAWGENTYQLARHTPNLLVNGNSILVNVGRAGVAVV